MLKKKKSVASSTDIIMSNHETEYTGIGGILLFLYVFKLCNPDISVLSTFVALWWQS
jgi:hypothetical protein